MFGFGVAICKEYLVEYSFDHIVWRLGFQDTPIILGVRAWISSKFLR